MVYDPALSCHVAPASSGSAKCQIMPLVHAHALGEPPTFAEKVTPTSVSLSILLPTVRYLVSIDSGLILSVKYPSLSKTESYSSVKFL